MSLVVQTTPQPRQAAARCAPDAAFWPATVLAAISAFAVILLNSSAALAEPGKPQSIVPEDRLEKLDVSKFSRPTQITNKWLPMKPGTRFVYDGTTVEDDGKAVPHQIVINITDLVKTIAGVRTLVSYDLDYTEGELAEAELAFYAQDDDGNIWRFGEYPEEYDGKKFVKAPAWIHGIQDARAGIMMKAEPRPGTPSYSQGYGPAVNWTDRGQVHAMGEEVTVGAKRYTDVLVIRETSEEEDKVGAAQLKYYAAGVGNIKVGWMGSADKSKEMLELTRIEQLDAGEMAAVRAKALTLEKSAYRRSKNVYGRTAPATADDSTGR
jgi:hypothetical protein